MKRLLSMGKLYGSLLQGYSKVAALDQPRKSLLGMGIEPADLTSDIADLVQIHQGQQCTVENGQHQSDRLMS
jgi:hypothetical protein